MAADSLACMHYNWRFKRLLRWLWCIVPRKGLYKCLIIIMMVNVDFIPNDVSTIEKWQQKAEKWHLAGTLRSACSSNNFSHGLMEPPHLSLGLTQV